MPTFFLLKSVQEGTTCNFVGDALGSGDRTFPQASEPLLGRLIYAPTLSRLIKGLPTQQPDQEEIKGPHPREA